jgi:hypothetical protein
MGAPSKAQPLAELQARHKQFLKRMAKLWAQFLEDCDGDKSARKCVLTTRDADVVFPTGFTFPHVPRSPGP